MWCSSLRTIRHPGRSAFPDTHTPTHPISTSCSYITSNFGGNNISGVKKVVEWIQPHPLTDQTIVGVVRSWSPTSAYLAGKAKKGKLSKEPEPKSVIESSSEVKEDYSSSGVTSNTDF